MNYILIQGMDSTGGSLLLFLRKGSGSLGANAHFKCSQNRLQMAEIATQTNGVH